MAGSPTASIQEIDVKTGLVMYEWTSLDHVGLRESYERASSSFTSWPFDYFHINSINLDPDGSLLVSARNTWTVYDIDAAQRADPVAPGGQALAASPRVRARASRGSTTRASSPGGSISMFDNGASPGVHGSRAASC